MSEADREKDTNPFGRYANRPFNPRVRPDYKLQALSAQADNGSHRSRLVDYLLRGSRVVWTGLKSLVLVAGLVVFVGVVISYALYLLVIAWTFFTIGHP